MVLLAVKVSDEKQHLEDQFDHWLHLIQSNTPFQVRLEEARLIDYIKKAKKLVGFEGTEIDEEEIPKFF